MDTSRRRVWASSAGLVVVAGMVAGGAAGPMWAVPASALWGVAVLRGERLPAASALAVCVVLHLLLAVSPYQSNDLHRYLWEGHVQLAGFSPYATAPADPALVPLRDARFEQVAHPELPTVYPPLAQASFVLAAALGLGETGYRNGIVLASVLLGFGIAAWLRSTGRPVGRVAIYAWSPVGVLAAAGGHIDVLMVAGLVGFAWAWDRERFAWAGLALGGAILAKTMAVLVLPWALVREPRAMLATVPAVVALGYAPYVPAGELLGSLGTFALDFRFNAPLHSMLQAGFGASASFVAGGLLAVWVAVCAWRIERPADAAASVFLGLLLLAPVVHYWYWTWPLALLPGVRDATLRVAVIACAASASLSAPLYVALASGSPVPDAPWWLALELAIPLVAVGAHGMNRAMRSAEPVPFEGANTS